MISKVLLSELVWSGVSVGVVVAVAVGVGVVVVVGVEVGLDVVSDNCIVLWTRVE